MDRDLFMDAREAKDYGIVDQVSLQSFPHNMCSISFPCFGGYRIIGRILAVFA